MGQHYVARFYLRPWSEREICTALISIRDESFIVGYPRAQFELGNGDRAQSSESRRDKRSFCPCQRPLFGSEMNRTAGVFKLFEETVCVPRTISR